MQGDGMLSFKLIIKNFHSYLNDARQATGFMQIGITDPVQRLEERSYLRSWIVSPWPAVSDRMSRFGVWRCLGCIQQEIAYIQGSQDVAHVDG